MRRRIIAAGFSALALVALAAPLIAPASAHAIGRDTILARGKVWVDKHVPYSQSGWANEYGNVVSTPSQGWRRDCSGFASYCLNLRYSSGAPLSYDSSTITKVLEPITKEELQPGDIINRSRLYPGAAYGHAIVFVGWADPDHDHYWSYEESGGSGGAVMRLVPYPFWDPVGFYPYRYKFVDEQRYEEWVEPIDGASRYDTAVEASRRAFATGTVDTVVVASGTGWADALGGSSLAGSVGGPILLTQPTALPACVPVEIARLGATRAIIVGGTGAVDPAVETALRAAGILDVDRIGGADRFDTAARVASATIAEGGGTDSTVYVSSGVSFPDALAASPVAAAFRRPILLSKPESLPVATADALASLDPTRVILLGGTNALSAQVASECLAPGRDTARLAGPDRYTTAAMIAEHGVAEGLDWNGLATATGQTFPDALAGGVAQGALGSPLVLTPTDWLHPAPRALYSANASEVVRAKCFGGLRAVSSAARYGIAVRLGMPPD